MYALSVQIYFFPVVDALYFSSDTIFLIYTLHLVLIPCFSSIHYRVKSGKFGHQVNSGTHLQTV